MKRIGVVLILLLAFCGLADSAYLAQNESSGTPLTCTVEGLTDCDTVATSSYARFLGAPLAAYGMFFYGALFVLAALELVFCDRLLRRAIRALAVVGVAASVYFLFIQVFRIKAFCIYCDVSAAITVLVLILAMLIEPVKRRLPPKLPRHLPMPPV